MRKAITTAAVVATLTVLPVSTAFATTPPADDAADVSTTDDSDDGGFDDWGLLGLLGLAGLAGLKRRDDNDRRVGTTVRNDTVSGPR